MNYILDYDPLIAKHFRKGGKEIHTEFLLTYFIATMQ